MRVDPKVLVVEDESRMRDVLVRAITSWGINAVGAHSGEEAIRMMTAEPRQIVLLDLNLPAMSGMELFERLKQNWPAIQVIVLTGFGDLDAAKKAIHLDVVEFLTKPAHLGDLELALDRARRRVEEAAQPPSVQVDSSPELEEDGEQDFPAPSSEATTLAEVERQHILAALSRNKGNRSATAQELGISLRTLYYRLSEYQKDGYRVDGD
jgi:DNA-binding NtrC family response regulator